MISSNKRGEKKMAIITNDNRKPTIDLRGPAGNAFAVIGAAKSLAEKLGYTSDEVNLVISDMKSSDYDHLIQVFDDHFGDYVDLIR